MADLKVEGHSHLIRDEESHAIINTDVEQYRLTMRRRQIMRNQREDINNLKGLEVDIIYEWKPGDLLVFDRTRLHCSSSNLVEKKIGFTTATSKN